MTFIGNIPCKNCGLRHTLASLCKTLPKKYFCGDPWPDDPQPVWCTAICNKLKVRCGKDITDIQKVYADGVTEFRCPTCGKPK